MFGFLIGTACLIGLIATLRRGYGGGAAADMHTVVEIAVTAASSAGAVTATITAIMMIMMESRSGWGGYRRGPRAWVSMLSHRLDLTPAQEKVVSQSFGEVKDALRKGRGELKETRLDVAKAFRAGSFDAVLMGETFSRHDNGIDEVRKAVTGALSRIHDALDEKQREKLAEILEEGWW